MSWIRSIWSGPSGRGSSARIGTSLATVSSLALVWVSTLTGRDIPPGAQVVLLALLGTSTAAYATGKLTQQKENLP